LDVRFLEPAIFSSGRSGFVFAKTSERKKILAFYSLMITLPRLPIIRLKPLTPELAAHLREESSRALNGDGQCSLRDMHTSCFASESCARGGGGGMLSPLTLDHLVSQPLALVAVAEAGFRGDLRERFVGCVSAAPAVSHHLFPHRAFEPGSFLLSNLCVADAYRKEGVGRRLIDAVRERATPAPTYLLVAKRGEQSTDPDVAAAFRDRVPRLRSTYDRMGFRPCDECDDAFLMLHE
jgi:GNAT superfamily N-acetyltransferase